MVNEYDGIFLSYFYSAYPDGCKDYVRSFLDGPLEDYKIINCETHYKDSETSSTLDSIIFHVRSIKDNSTKTFDVSYAWLQSGKSLGPEDYVIDHLGFLKKYFDNMEIEVENPVNEEIDDLSSVIIELNDNHGWSREQIADWIDTLDVDLSIK